jgi:hypothetical protein
MVLDSLPAVVGFAIHSMHTVAGARLIAVSRVICQRLLLLIGTLASRSRENIAQSIVAAHRANLRKL